MATNISSVGTASRDYSTFGGWEGATDIDLVTAGNIEVGEFYADSEFSDTSQRGIIGATTDASNYRIARPAAGEGYNAITDTGVVFNNSTTSRCFEIGENYFRFIGPFRINSTGAGTTWPIVRNYNDTTNTLIDSLFVVAEAARGTGIQHRDSGQTCEVRNCIVTDDTTIAGGSGSIVKGYQGYLGTMNLDNCIAYSTATGFDQGFDDRDITTCQNCISIDAATYDYDSGISDSYCIAGDASLAGIVKYENESAADIWNDPASGDFRPKSTGNAKDNGTDLSAKFSNSIEEGVNHGDDSGSWNIGPYDGAGAAAVNTFIGYVQGFVFG